MRPGSRPVTEAEAAAGAYRLAKGPETRSTLPHQEEVADSWPETFDRSPGLPGSRIVYTGRLVPSRDRRVVVSYRPRSADPYAVHYLLRDERQGVRYTLHQGTYVDSVKDAVKEVRRRYNLLANPTPKAPRPAVVIREAILENTERVA